MKTSDPNITASLSAFLAGKKKLWQSHVNRISALDDACLRKLFYMRAAWDKAKPTDDGLQGILETGNILEPVIERIVSEVGMAAAPQWRIVGTQTQTNDALLKRYQISGTIDGFLQVKDESGQWITLGVIDIKTMSANIFRQIDGYDDLARYPWTSRYRGQVMMYALANGVDRCYLLLVNKQNLFDMKLIGFNLDMEYCEGLLKKAESINQAIESNEPPQKINDPSICPSCAWYSYCAPELTLPGNLMVSDNVVLEETLERLDDLQEISKEISELERERDKMLVKGQDLACGRFVITWKEIEVHRKAQEARTETQFRKSITSGTKGAS